jgi:hypothetical protein
LRMVVLRRFIHVSCQALVACYRSLSFFSSDLVVRLLARSVRACRQSTIRGVHPQQGCREWGARSLEIRKG